MWVKTNHFIFAVIYIWFYVVELETSSHLEFMHIIVEGVDHTGLSVFTPTTLDTIALISA